MSIREKCRPFSRPDDRLAWRSLTLSVAIAALGLAFPAIWPASWLSLLVGSLLFGTAVLRLYSIQHDCGHYSYFTSRPLNDRIGTWLSLFSGIAYSVSKHNHNLHHAHLGDISQRDAHEVFTMARSEYEAAPLVRRLAYRVYRHPLMLFFFGPLWVYFVQYRWPRNTVEVSVRDVIVQNLTMFGFWALIILLLGWWAFFAVLLGSYMAGVFGIFTVYIQHNFETTYWSAPDARNAHQAALTGSSRMDLGPVVDFVLLNVGYHDLHHLNAKIPCYHLKHCHQALTEELNHARIGLWEACRCLKLRLWDETASRMVPFPRTLVQELAA